MDAIQDFLNELQKRIDAVSGQVIDFENEKNTILAINNILFKYSLDKDNITGLDLINVDEKDLREIFKIKYEGEELDNILNKFKLQARVVSIYQNLINKYGEGNNPPQYVEAKEFIDKIAKELTSDMSRFIERNKAYIEASKKSVSLPKKYLALFAGGKLNSPIYDFTEFNDYVNNLGFSLEERAELKKVVGEANYNLVMNSKTKEQEKIINKYSSILVVKKSKYQAAYDLIKNENFILSNVDDDLSRMMEKYNLDFMNAKQAITCVLLEKNLQEYEKAIANSEMEDSIKREYLLTLENIFENIMVFSRKHEVKVATESGKINPDEEMITKVEKILHDEKDLIAATDQEKLEIYLAQNIDANTSEAIRYKIVSILIEMLSSLNKFKEIIKMDDESLKYNHDQELGNLNRYIETYLSLKEILTKKESTFKYLILDEAEIIKAISSLNKTEYKSFLENLDSLVNGNLGASKKLSISNKKLSVYNLNNIVYMRLANNFLLILSYGEKEINDIVNKLEKQISEEIVLAQNEENINQKYNDQKEIREHIKNISTKGSE